MSVLVPAAATTTIPVSCVEARRWGSPAAARRSEFHAPAALRARKAASVAAALRRSGSRRSDQGEVWRDVEHYRAAAQAAAPTDALEDVFRHRQAEVDPVVQRLRPQHGQAGVLAMWGDGAAALDLFDTPDTLRDYWDCLLRGYAIDMVAAPPGRHGATDAERFMQAVAHVAVSRGSAVGEGVELHGVADPARTAAEDLCIAGLEWHGRLVHLAAFSAGAGAAQ